MGARIRDAERGMGGAAIGLLGLAVAIIVVSGLIVVVVAKFI